MLFDFFIYLSRADIFPWRVIIASPMEHEVITIFKKRAIFEWCFTIIIPLNLWNNWIPFFLIFSIVSINFSFKISINNYDFVNPFFLEIRIIVFYRSSIYLTPKRSCSRCSNNFDSKLTIFLPKKRSNSFACIPSKKIESLTVFTSNFPTIPEYFQRFSAQRRRSFRSLNSQIRTHGSLVQTRFPCVPLPLSNTRTADFVSPAQCRV